MATAVYDSFTDAPDTLLPSHTPDTGGVWTKHPSFTADLAISNANRCRQSTASSGAALYYNAKDPGADNYYVQAQFNIITNTSGYDALCVAARISASVNTCYFARWDSTTNGWQLYKTVSGTSTLLGSYAISYSPGEQHTGRLTLGTSSQVVTVDGTDRISATDSSITARGYGGIRQGNGGVVGSDTNGVHLDDFYLVNALVTGGAKVPWHLFMPVAGGA
jgi:hypothetical protein